MMLIDMTPQFAVIAEAMNLFLAVSAGALAFAVLREGFRARATQARRALRLQAAARA